MLTQSGSVVMAFGGPVLGQRQTVPRAELTGLKWLLRATRGDFTIAIDAMYVLKGLRKLKKGLFPGTNTDIWADIGELVRGRSCTSVHVKSHRDHQALVEGVPPL